MNRKSDELAREERSESGRNRRFDEFIEDPESGYIQVTCKVGGEEVSLVNPSSALYFGDRTLYEQEAKRFEQEERERILNSSEWPQNLKLFEELRKSCRRGLVIPFVGAGMSVSAGCYGWKEYLVRLCAGARGLDGDAIRRRLEVEGDYEGVTDEIVEAITERRFERDFDRDFRTSEDFSGTVTLIPRLFDGSVVTTNFDRVLEDAFFNEGYRFTGTVNGRGATGAFFRAIPAGDRYLLKLHGSVDNVEERVLRKAEYELAYGAGQEVDLDFPLPRVLRRLFLSYSLVFLGCSLVADRTIKTLAKIAESCKPQDLPYHYAILEYPSNTEVLEALERRLADAHISPIWFPEGQFQCVEEILQLLEA